MGLKKKLSLDELKVLVFEKGEATKANKDKLFKVAKANKDTKTIKRLRDELGFKSAKMYLDKLHNLSAEDNVKIVIDNEFDNSKMNIKDYISWQNEILKEHYGDTSSTEDDIDIIITSPFDTVLELQTAKDLCNYQSILSKLTYSELSIELSNIMAARDNILSFAIHSNGYGKIQEKITDLANRILAICRQNFDDYTIMTYGLDDCYRLVTTIDHELLQEALSPEQHGRKMLDKIGQALMEHSSNISTTEELIAKLNFVENYLSALEDLENGYIYGKHIYDEVTPLHIASYSGKINLVKKLLNNKFELDAVDSIDNATPLIRAAQKGYSDIVKILLESGANINAKTNADWTPLLVAVNAGKYDTVKVLIENGADIDCKLPDGANALILASLTGKIKIAKLLIEQGININQKLTNNFNSLMIAIDNNHNDIAKLLIENKIDINAYTPTEGINALYLSYKNNNLSMFKFLLENGANPNHLYSPLHTILDLCTFEKSKEYIDILEKHGGKRCNVPSFDKKVTLDHDLIIEDVLDKVDQSITSTFVARQFVLEEIEAASYSENSAIKEFAESSGFDEKEYRGAMNRSFSEVDGSHGGQQILLSWLALKSPNTFYEPTPLDVLKLLRARLIIVEFVMKKYSLGKHAIKIIKLDIQNQKNTFNIFIFDEYAIDSELHRYEKIKNNKYYSPELKKYIEIDNQKVFIYEKTQIDEVKNNETEYSIISKKEIYEYEFNNYTSEVKKQSLSHNPKALVKILNLFTEENPLKYTAHSFEWSKFETYENFMEKVKSKFEEIENDLKILSLNLHKKIYGFLLDSNLGESATWGVQKMNFGWSSQELKEWCKEEDSKPDGRKAIRFELPTNYIKEVNNKTCSTFGDVCDVFKNEIEIRDDDKLKTLFATIKKDVLKFDFDVQYKNLENISFYTDVENFKNGLVLIFEQFREDGREQYDTIEIEAIPNENEKYVDIRIIQINSTVVKKSYEMQNETENGHFEDIKNNFSSLCDWSIEAEFSDGNFRINYLSSDDNSKEPIPLDDKPLGFTHILRFYK